jgi:anti-anti-sigma factor
MTSLFRVINLPAVLDSMIASQLHQEIQVLVQSGIKVVLLDFKNVEMINSSGLIALGAVSRIVRNSGGKLLTYSMNEQIKILFELTGLDRVFETVINLDEFSMQYS